MKPPLAGIFLAHSRFCEHSSVAAQILWSHPEKFQGLHLRLGGMYALKSFVGSIGTLMAESGLSEVLSSVFAGVPKMLSGKQFSQNVRALRLLAEEVLRFVYECNYSSSDEGSDKILGKKSQSKQDSTIWQDVLIKPVFINL